MGESVGKMLGHGTAPFARLNRPDQQNPALSAIVSCSVQPVPQKVDKVGCVPPQPALSAPPFDKDGGVPLCRAKDSGERAYEFDRQRGAPGAQPDLADQRAQSIRRLRAQHVVDQRRREVGVALKPEPTRNALNRDREPSPDGRRRPWQTLTDCIGSPNCK